MDELKQLAEINWWYVIISICLLLIVVKFIWSLLDWFLFQKLKIETGKMKKQREEHELLISTAKGLTELQNRHISDNDECVKHDKEIRDDLKKLTNLFIEKQIDDMRYEILDFASSLSSGRKYNKEQFDHILSIDEKYKKILEDNGLENGQVTVSVEYINEVYKEKLRNGF